MNDLLTLEPRDIDATVMEPDVAVEMTEGTLHDMNGIPAKVCCVPHTGTGITGPSRF
jgi:hypothetical protein